MPVPTENLRPLSTGERFTLLVADIIEVMPNYGYSGRVADFAICQAAHETGLFTSDLLLRADNAFGMRPASQRPQPWRIDVSNGYAVYADLNGSVNDYFDRQRAFGIPNTDNADLYIQETVASGYATAGAYAQAWRGLLNRVEADGFASAFGLEGIQQGNDAAAAASTSLLPLLLAFGVYKMVS